jgi:hypothetical protein
MNEHLIIAVLIFLFLLFNSNNSNEGFSLQSVPNPKCLDCYYKKANECMDCGNCGICVNGRFSKCIPGDEHGPYFNDGCEKWIWKDHKKGKVYNRPEIYESRPWNWNYKQYPMQGSISPVSRSTLG